MIFYLPLEPYVERYTWFMSAKNGWAETTLKENGLEFTRVDGKTLGCSIKNGVVLDACGRSYYAMSQMMEMVSLLNNGSVKDGDIVYVEDFWHPGIESLFYIRHLLGLKFKIGTFIHAQSIDDTDFAYAMRDWMRPIEQGYGTGYDFIFTCSYILRDLCINNRIGTPKTVFKVGLPYNSKRLLEQLDISCENIINSNKDYVLFASRFDDEKDPMFFLDVVEECPDIEFKLVNPRKNRPITNNEKVIKRLSKLLERPNSNLQLVDTSDKKTYYETVMNAKVMFNCANQDWVSWTLLEGITFRCLPLYPIWKDFPYELNYDRRYLYNKRDLNDCVNKLRSLMTQEFDDNLNEVVEFHDKSFITYMKIMMEGKV